MTQRETFMILNVDDNEASRYAKSRILKRAGYEVLEAGDGSAALRLVKERHPQLVLLDVKLPDIMGTEVCRRIKQEPESANTMVLQISASHVTVPDRVLSLDSGADTYLTEPVDSTELVATVGALLRLYQREEENRRLVAELREADQKKNEFLAILAHELRNPLHSIRGAIEILSPEEQQDPERRLSCQIIDQQVNYLSRLIDDLLDVARITRDKIDLRKSTVDLAQVVKTAVDASRMILESHGHRVQVTLPPPGVQIDVDPVRLNQVIENLLDNAAKYTPRGGTIQVTAAAEDDHALISVKDNGIGIAREKLPQIFEQFYRVDSSLERTTSGLGLGLNLARRLVELHGGTITARSEGLGRGSEFIVSLPAPLQAGAPEESPTADTSDPVEGTRWRILIVDDGVRTREMYSLLLAKRGHTVETAADGRAAVQLAETFQPEVILLDVGMPGMNGFEVCQRVRMLPSGQDRILVAVTGWAREDVQERADRAGFDAILVKPVGVQEILRVAQRVSESKQAQRR